MEELSWLGVKCLEKNIPFSNIDHSLLKYDSRHGDHQCSKIYVRTVNDSMTILLKIS